MNVIFWDFDGTLVYSEHLWSGSMYRAIREINPTAPVTFEAIRICNREGFTWQAPDEDHTALLGEAWWEHMSAHFYRSFLTCGADHDSAIAAAHRTRDIILRPENYSLYNDAPDTLACMRRRGYRNILLSNNYPELHTVTDAIGLTPYLDGIIVSALEGYDKPRQELFDIAKTRFPAKRYYMIGDNVIADIEGGNRSGMTTILVHSGHIDTADYCCNTLREIPFYLP